MSVHATPEEDVVPRVFDSATCIITRLLEFFPDPAVVALGAGIGLAAFLAAGTLAGLLRRGGWRDGDTRKIFHIVIFTTAAFLRVSHGIGAVAAFGSVVFCGVLLAVRRGEGDLVFEALARQVDHPRRGLHVIVPLLATAVGGVTAHLVAGPLAGPAFLVAGWGDAVGEPVGIRWGRRRFRVPTIGGVAATRSIEGTAAVLVASTAAAFVGLSMLGLPPAAALGNAVLVGAAATIVESVSPHGLDNFTILASTACLVRALGVN